MADTRESSSVQRPSSREDWLKVLEALPSPSETGRIPAFFFGHGSPLLLRGEVDMGPISDSMGPKSPMAVFLQDFGPLLLKKYNPKGIVVFSAHWESDSKGIQVTDYGDENPLLMDYYGFEPSLYKIKFKSRGSSELTNTVIQTLSDAGVTARASPASEPRGRDGRGFSGPGLDHGVFVPFKLMFGDEFLSVPIVQVPIDGSLKPEANYALGQAVAKLRSEGILILSGGLIIHNLRDRSSWTESTASQGIRDFVESVVSSVEVKNLNKRKTALYDLVKHPAFRSAHPREDHFVPIYVAAGAGEVGDVRLINTVFTGPTIAFGV